MSALPGASPAASVELAPPRALATAAPLRLLAGTYAMGQAELRKLRHDHLDLFTRSVQPLLWLFVFGTALQPRTRCDRRRRLPRLLDPGRHGPGGLFISIFFGLAVIWERDVGQFQRLLATPLPRTAIVLGKSAGASRARAGAGGRAARRAGRRRIGLRWSVAACSARSSAGPRHRRVRVPVDADRRDASRTASASWASASW